MTNPATPNPRKDTCELNTCKRNFFIGLDSDCVKDCKEGWEANRQHCFFWSIASASWDEAEQTCQKEGGHLASVTSNATNQYILSGLDKRGIKENLWIGGRDSKEEGTWEWTDESAWEFSYWGPRRPNSDYRQNCLQYHGSFYNPLSPIFKYVWWDFECEERSRFLCSQKLCSGE